MDGNSLREIDDRTHTDVPLKRREKETDEANWSAETTLRETTIQTSQEMPPHLLPHLQPPSSDEAKGYYAGLPSMPLLVGRTSAGVVSWPPPSSPLDLPWRVLPTKSLAPIGRHRIRACWESGVREKIVHALGGLDWTTVDAVRIGYDHVPVLERPVVVWVGVSNAAQPWNPTVCEALRTCWAILDQAGLLDVECEIRVSRVQQLAGPRPHSSSPPQLLDKLSDDNLYSISAFVGTSMCPAQMENHVGSLCIYLAPARGHTSTGPLWALTCRHVALPREVYPLDKAYKRTNTKNTNQPAIEINLPAAEDLDHGCNTIESRVKFHKANANDGMEDENARRLLSVNEHLLRKMKRFEPAASRLAGSVFVAPVIEQAEYWGEGSQTPYLWSRDWCLIELDRRKFPNNAADLTNQVFLMAEDGTDGDLNRRLNTNSNNRIKFKLPDNYRLRLSGVIPVAEIRETESLNNERQ